MIKKNCLILTLVLLMISFAGAVEMGGAILPDTLPAGQETLVLNGAGLRKKFFVSVYAAGVYLKQKTTDTRKIIESDEPMAIRMNFIHDEVSAEKLIAAWNEGFSNATAGNTGPLQKEIAQFNAMFTDGAKKGDIYDIIYTPGQGVSVIIKEKPVGKIEGLAFKKALFSIWLGDNPVDSSLKQGLSGQ